LGGGYDEKFVGNAGAELILAPKDNVEFQAFSLI
jgi:hypothetical protein